MLWIQYDTEMVQVTLLSRTLACTL